jgi:hypothetical protein
MGSRITPRKVAGKNGHRTTVFARFGLLDPTAQCNLCNLLRSGTPPQAHESGSMSIFLWWSRRQTQEVVVAARRLAVEAARHRRRLTRATCS